MPARRSAGAWSCDDKVNGKDIILPVYAGVAVEWQADRLSQVRRASGRGVMPASRPSLVRAWDRSSSYSSRNRPDDDAASASASARRPRRTVAAVASQRKSCSAMHAVAATFGSRSRQPPAETASSAGPPPSSSSQSARRRYVLYRVYEADTTTPSYLPIRDPIGSFDAGEIRFDLDSLKRDVGSMSEIHSPDTTAAAAPDASDVTGHDTRPTSEPADEQC